MVSYKSSYFIHHNHPLPMYTILLFRARVNEIPLLTQLNFTLPPLLFNPRCELMKPRRGLMKPHRELMRSRRGLRNISGSLAIPVAIPGLTSYFGLYLLIHFKCISSSSFFIIQV